jgi:hypothetical protein
MTDMFNLFLMLTLLSGVILVIGLVATTVTRKSTGAQTATEPGLDATPAEQSAAAMRGTDAQVQAEADDRFAAMKRAVQERRWRDAAPSLLVFHGIIGLLLFGALALLAGTDMRLVGITAAGVAIYAVGRMWWNLSRT